MRWGCSAEKKADERRLAIQNLIYTEKIAEMIDRKKGFTYNEIVKNDFESGHIAF